MQPEIVYIARGAAPGTATLARRSAADGHFVATSWSVVSPGTERWQLGRDERAASPLGYMAIGERDGEHLLAPSPHGTHLDAANPGTLAASASAEIIAVARFQLMAAAGLRPVVARVREAERFAVVGTGPVAIAAALEILRSSDAAVTVITRHPERAQRLLDGLDRVAVAGYDALRAQPNVIECTGEAANIQACIAGLAEGALLGLLGSPRELCTTDVYAIHRAGATLLGMHELAGFDPDWRRTTFREIAAWLAETRPHEQRGWIAATPASDFGALYERLYRSRLGEPFQLLDWRSYS